ncbi:acetylornithine transaminase [Agrilactobacillus fermenti]|uniref:acetylornithine transaminase n=1 Tax=Agrilactobacillus fermenti TaxID=2586909 RepID=UPI001E2F6DEC|nr:acetylornithine transaminase [Agrilactobacillus fermenti]MCD2256928.1 acetylornithine transaminase [Agrilactobacillus fermenti]
MSHLFPTYHRYPIEIDTGQDWQLTDNHGQTYLDFTSGIGVCNFGYHNALIQANVQSQLNKVWHTSNLYQNQLQEIVANSLTAGTDKLTFFCNSGTEANEAAIKLARKYTGKSQIIAFTNGFHGRTYGALSVTDNPPIKTGFGPFVPNMTFAPYNDSTALPLITSETAAVILEVIQGEGGVILGNRSWLQQVQTQCQTTDTLLIIDEVQTGMGRTGHLFAYQQFDLDPDIITLAKALANGIPVGAMLGRAQFQSAFGPGSHGSTFGGNLLAMAAAEGVLAQLTPDFLKQVHLKGQHFLAALQTQLASLSTVTKIQGMGLMIGIQLSETVMADIVVRRLQQQGLLTLTAKHNTLRLLPPLITPEAVLMDSIPIIKASLEAQYESVTG